MSMKITAHTEWLSNGWNDEYSILIDGDLGLVYDGNHRVAAARQLGWTDEMLLEKAYDVRDIVADWDSHVAQYTEATRETDEHAYIEAAIMVLDTMILSNPELCNQYGIFGGH